MQIILLQNVKNVGEKGQVKNVPDGYARNFLLKNKLAALATAALIAKAEQEQVEKKSLEDQTKKQAIELAQTLNTRIVAIKAKASSGKLFGSITAKEIVAELKKMGYTVPEKSVHLPHIKELGQHKVPIELDHKISAQITLNVEQI